MFVPKCDWKLFILISETPSVPRVAINTPSPLQWRHNEGDTVSNHWRLDCLLNHMFRRRSKKTAKLCFTGLYEGNSPVTGEFPSQRASNAENVSIRWRHYAICISLSSTLHNFFAWEMITRSHKYWCYECAWILVAMISETPIIHEEV